MSERRSPSADLDAWRRRARDARPAVLDRRTFARGLAASAALALASPLLAAPARSGRRLKVGHTGITWGYAPADAVQAIADVASLGFHAFETFGRVLEAWEAKGGLKRVLDERGLRLHSAYCPVDLTDPGKRRGEVDKLARWARLIRASGGQVAVVGPGNVTRQGFRFLDHRAHIVEALNDMARAAADAGVLAVLHPHTGTSVETAEEVHAVFEAADTRHLKFGPDVGQLQKAGADPVKIVRDFLPLVRHVHLKDFGGADDREGYVPLGAGRVDLVAIVDVLESSGNDLVLMCELDPADGSSIAPREAARLNRQAMEGLGYALRP